MFKLFSKIVVPFFFIESSYYSTSSLAIDIVFFFLILAILIGAKWYLIVFGFTSPFYGLILFIFYLFFVYI